SCGYVRSLRPWAARFSHGWNGTNSQSRPLPLPSVKASDIAILAPVIVVAAGLILLWGKVAAQHLRESRRPRLVLALWVLGIALLFLLSFLGVKLPKGE